MTVHGSFSALHPILVQSRFTIKITSYIMDFPDIHHFYLPQHKPNTKLPPMLVVGMWAEVVS